MGNTKRKPKPEKRERWWSVDRRQFVTTVAGGIVSGAVLLVLAPIRDFLLSRHNSDLHAPEVTTRRIAVRDGLSIRVHDDIPLTEGLSVKVIRAPLPTATITTANATTTNAIQ